MLPAALIQPCYRSKECRDGSIGISLTTSSANSTRPITKTFVFVVDDWNYDALRLGTHKAITDLNLEVLFSIEIR